MVSDAGTGAHPTSTLDFEFRWGATEHARARHEIAVQRFRSEGLAIMLWIALALFCILNIVALIVAFRGEATYLEALLPWTLLVALGVWFWFWGRGRLDAFRQRGDATLQHAIHLLLGENGLRVRNRSAEVTHGWRSLSQIVETREFVIFHIGLSAYYLPKRVASPDELTALRALIRANRRGAAQLMLGLAALLAGLTPTAHAQLVPTRTVPASWGTFVQAFDAFVHADSIIGAGTVLMQDGRVALHHETGWGDRALNQRADERSIYHWASNTKTLTAVAIMQLRDRGLLTLDAPVTRWVPELRQVHNPFGSMDAITIRMLLSHTAGFQNPTWPYTSGKPWEPFEPTRWEQLVAMMPYQEIAFPPGTRWSYSNPAFIYLARIIEAITGDPYQSYIQKNLWTPLGMTRSYFGATPYHLAGQRSNNYTVRADSAGHEAVTPNGRDFDPGITIPNGGWNAPLADVAAWLAFLNGAAHGDTALARVYDTVLRHSSVEEMWRSVIPLAPGDRAGDTFGLSFFLRREGDALLVGHTGEQAGFRSFMFLNPRTGAAIIANFNTTNDAHPRESGAGFAALLRQAQDLIAR